MRRLALLAAGTAAIALPASSNAQNGPQTWAQAGCGGCHTLAAAGSTGTAGPDLDALRPSSSAVANQVTYGGPGMPSFGSSLSSSDIQQLADWIAATTGGGGTVAASPSVAPTSPTVDLPTATVLRLQHELARLGYFHGPFTGFYGPLTTAAVKRFQRSEGLHADGIWGPHSSAALKRRTGVRI
jgi:cytochrome c553